MSASILDHDREGDQDHHWAYGKLDCHEGDVSGPLIERVGTAQEVATGHDGVLMGLRAMAGRWLLWLEIDRHFCANCDDYGGRYLQFAALEDGSAIIGEVSHNRFLHEALRFDKDQEQRLRDLGWRDPLEGTTPNWHFVAVTDDDLALLAEMTYHTLFGVCGRIPWDDVLIRCQERILAPRI